MADRINEVRKALEPIWRKAQAVGRCWQKKSDKSNPLATSHITFLGKEEAVTVFYYQGQLYLIEYKVAVGTTLGNAVKEILKKEGKEITNY